MASNGKPVKFSSRRERYEFLKAHNMTDVIAEIQEAFGKDIKLSNVGYVETEKKPVKNLWEGMGIKTK